MKTNKEKNFIQNKIFHFETTSNRSKEINSEEKINNIYTFTISNKPKNKNYKSLKHNFANKDIFNLNQKIKKTIIKNKEQNINIKSMGEIINKLTVLKNKINKINLNNKKKINLFKLYNPIKIFKPKTLTKNKTKNKYLLYINDYYKNRHKLFLQKNKTIDLEIDHKNINKEENELNHKNIINLKSFDDKFNNNNINDKRQRNCNTLSSDNISNVSNSKTIDKKYLSGNIKKILNNNKIKKNHIKYIEKIKNNELLDLRKRYKKSLNQNKNEEIFHYRSLVFPPPLINYLIQLKKKLIIDKYRNEYIKKIERFNFYNILSEIKKNNNNINFLNVMK